MKVRWQIQYGKRRALRRSIAVALAMSMAALLLQALPVMSADEDLYVANWLKPPAAPAVLPVGAEFAWDETGVGVSCVIPDGSTYKMWYTGYNRNDVFQIGLATSDGVGQTWTKHGPPVLPPGTPDAWDDKGVGSPCVIKVGDADYRMWYTGYQQVDTELVPQVGYATSEDGETWSKHGAAVLHPGPGAWDEKGVHSAWVIYDVDTFKMWYTGRTGTSLIGDSQIGYAESADGITNWQKHSDNDGRVLSTGTSGAWDDRGVAVPCVLKGTDNKYYLWYSGYSGFGEQVQVAVGVAKSNDGMTGWSKNPQPVLVKEEGFNSGGTGAPRVLELSATELVMWYSGLDTQVRPRVGTASVERTTLTVTVELQGGLRPDPAGFQVPLTLKLYDPATVLDIHTVLGETGPPLVPAAVPIYTYTGTGTGGDITISDINPGGNKHIDFTVDVPSGAYKITLVTPHSLITLREAVLTAPTDTIDLGVLLEGNGDDSVQITGADFTSLLNDYAQMDGDDNWWGGRSDYDRDGQVTSIDFSLLSMNYNEYSPQES